MFDSISKYLQFTTQLFLSYNTMQIYCLLTMHLKTRQISELRQ